MKKIITISRDSRVHGWWNTSRTIHRTRRILDSLPLQELFDILLGLIPLRFRMGNHLVGTILVLGLGRIDDQFLGLVKHLHLEQVALGFGQMFVNRMES